MSHLGNSQKDEVEYELGVKQRKRDAKKYMEQSAKIMNGELRQPIGQPVHQRSKKK